MYKIQAQSAPDGLWHDSVDLDNPYQDIAKAEADILRYGQSAHTYRVVEWQVKSVIRFVPPMHGHWDVKRINGA